MSLVLPSVLVANGLTSSDKYEEQRRLWGGGIRGNKSTQMIRKRARALGQTLSDTAIKKL